MGAFLSLVRTLAKNGGSSRTTKAPTRVLPRDIYELLRARILFAATPEAPGGYRALPRGYHFSLRLPGLAKEVDCPAIGDELWQRVLNREEPKWHDWRDLWQAVMLPDAATCFLRLQHEVEAAPSTDRLAALVRLLQFDGSLIVFRHPDVTRAFLLRARSLGGEEAFRDVRVQLYAASSPGIGGYPDVVLDRECDYVEAEALKAAEAQQSDPILGPFYRWIVKMEQKDRLWHKSRFEAELDGRD